MLVGTALDAFTLKKSKKDRDMLLVSVLVIEADTSKLPMGSLSIEISLNKEWRVESVNRLLGIVLKREVS